MASLRISSWHERALCIACGLLSHILVELSMSVNRKVTVPVDILLASHVQHGRMGYRRHRGSLTSFDPPNLYATPQEVAMALRFPDEAIGYLPLLSGGLLCRIVDMEFRESPFHEVG
jgi:hypothetical protein